MDNRIMDFSEKNNDYIRVSQDAIQRLIRSGSGDAALLYLYIGAHDGRLDRDAAANDMQRTDKDIRRALSTLMDLGLADPGGLADQGGDPSVSLSSTVEDILRTVFGRSLSPKDRAKLDAIRKQLGLPDEVILLLIDQCLKERRKQGLKNPPAMSILTQKAILWSELGLTSFEKAAAWLEAQQDPDEIIDGIAMEVGYVPEKLTAAERRMVASWLEAGMAPDVVVSALDRTILNLNRLDLKYANAILVSWRAKGIYRADQISALDNKPPENPSPSSRGTESDAAAIERLQRLIDRIRSDSD